MISFDKFSDIIIEKNNQFSVVQKPFGIPVQVDKSGDTSLNQLAGAYFKHDVHLSNRLDRPVGGLVLLAHKKAAAQFFLEETHADRVHKTYLALVKAEPKLGKGELIHHISKNGKTHKAIINDTVFKGSSECRLEYEHLLQMNHYQVLKIKLNTGKFHQIRSQLAHIDYPIQGDVKYGARRSNKDRSIGLFAYEMTFRHPITKEKLHFQGNIPEHNSLWRSIKKSLQPD